MVPQCQNMKLGDSTWFLGLVSCCFLKCIVKDVFNASRLCTNPSIEEEETSFDGLLKLVD